MNFNQRVEAATLLQESESSREAWPRNPQGTYLDSGLYIKAEAIARKHDDFQGFVDALSSELDIRYQNLDPAIQTQLKKLHDQSTSRVSW